ncbi:MAG TPA: hypothetical protein PJ992_08715 [Arachnia sp.]|nr:hypothetical protein [Arachnia sp.]
MSRGVFALAAGVLLAPAAVAVCAIVLIVVTTLRFPSERGIEMYWGIAVPPGLRVVERHSEPGFADGPGPGFTVFEADRDADLTETFFDPRWMSPVDLTSDQVVLVAEITEALQPENYLLLPHPGLRKAEVFRDDDVLLILLDEATGRFYVYESIR